MGAAGNGGAAGAACLAPATYAQSSLYNGEGETVVATNYVEEVQGNITSVAGANYLTVALGAGQGHFTSGITAGTYVLNSSDAQYATCSICILVYINAVDNNTGYLAADATYLATSGTLALTSVASGSTGTGTIAGLLSNVTLQQVTIDQATQTSTPVGACTTTISSLSFSESSTPITN